MPVLMVTYSTLVLFEQQLLTVLPAASLFMATGQSIFYIFLDWVPFARADCQTLWPATRDQTPLQVGQRRRL